MSNLERFRAGVEAVNARDWATHRAMLADNFTSVDYGTGETVRDPDEFVASQNAALVPFPDQVLSIESIAEAGDVVFAEIVSQATHTGPLPLPTGGSIPATGKQVTVHCAVVCKYDDKGQAVLTCAYYNPLEAMGQIGALPTIPEQVDLTAHAPAPTS